MNIHAKVPTTAEEFLAWNKDLEGRREFVRGRVVELMINTTRSHAVLSSRVVVALANALDQTKYDFGSADFAVKTRDGIRFPDVLVDMKTAETSGTDLAARHPVLLVEILSPSSHDRDFIEKVEDYTGLPTLEHYLILSQDEPRAWLWSRVNDGWPGPVTIFGRDARIALPGLGMSIDMGMLYMGFA
jgi:Uma2 family endonuclease